MPPTQFEARQELIHSYGKVIGAHQGE